MSISDSNASDQFDRTEVVLGDKDVRDNRAKVDEQGNQYSKVTLGDASQIDPWGRIRTSSPVTLFEANFNFSDRPLLMNTKLVSGGTSTFNSNISGVEMFVPTTIGASVIRQTKRYFRYVTGKGSVILTAFRPLAFKTNQFKGWGFFDAQDGMFFSQNASGLTANIRSSTSGSPVDTTIPQSSWNLDPLDGTGASGVTVDVNAYNVWVMDFAWQGAGGVRFGLFFNGQIIYCHEYQSSNTLTVPFTRTPVLPIRYEITNTGTVASATTVTHGTLGFMVDSSGTLSESALSFSESNQSTARNVTTTLAPLLAIRPKLLFNGRVNRVPIELVTAEVSSETQMIYYQIIRGATITGGTWISAGTNSAVEVTRTATSYSGGDKVAEGYVLASSQGSTRNLASAVTELNKLNFIGLDIDGAVQDNLIVVARTMTSTSNTYCVLLWEEFQ